MAAQRRTPTTSPSPGPTYMARVNEEVAALWNGVGLVVANVAGTNTITGTVTPTLDAWQNGQIYWLLPVAPNTSNVTININSRGAISARDWEGSHLAAGALQTGKLYGFLYNDAQLRLVTSVVVPSITLPFNPQGDWSAIVTYAQGDFVYHDTRSYFSKQNTNLNHEPPDGTWWQPVAGPFEPEVVESTPQGRLSLSAVAAVTVTDAAGAPSIYWVPAAGNRIPIYDGTNFVGIEAASGLSLDLDPDSGHSGYHQADSNFDLFAALDGATPFLGSGPRWNAGAGAGSNTLRGTGVGSTELEVVKGRLVNKNTITLRFGTASGDTIAIAARRATYLGSFRTTLAGLTEDSCTKRFLFNAYNDVDRLLKRKEPIIAWTYAVNDWRQQNANPLNQVELLRGLDMDIVEVDHSSPFTSSDATEHFSIIGIGLDSTTAFADDSTNQPGYAKDGIFGFLTCNYRGAPGLGYHKLTMLEYAAGVDTQTFYGDFSTPPTVFWAGLLGRCRA